ncbi:MAG TPA: serine/threonine protein kinase [Clostridia bacterium]|nr:serine/threonine protein kinase [Clostridia bacterium]
MDNEVKTNILQYLDGIPIRLKEPFNLDFLHQYGTMFKIYDTQSSGNLCFGFKKEGKRYFIKFAGAKTINDHDLPVEDAIARLKAAVTKYRELSHPSLIHLIKAEEISNGFAIVFDWEDGGSIGDLNPSLRERFLSLPIGKRMRVFEEILSFHAHVARCGYVAIDFNDNSILYDFDSDKVIICDIDFYAKQSYMNGMGSIFGIKSLMAPEEFRCAALLDEVTNVYTMGATAFMLFSNYDRSPEAWPLDGKLYSVVKRAVSDTRIQRQQSIRQLMEEWNAAKNNEL